MQVNIVTNFQILQEIKKSKYFQVHLGFVATVEKNGSRSFNENDSFSHFYNSQYVTTIYGQGKIGGIRFYTDHYIRESILAVYYGDNYQEFIVEFDNSIMMKKTIDQYLGSIIKDVEEQYEELVKNNELKKLEKQAEGDAEKLVVNPGGVTWADVKAFLEKEREKKRI